MAHIYCMINVSGQDEEILDDLAEVMDVSRCIPCLFYLREDAKSLRPSFAHRDRAEAYSRLEDCAYMFECGTKASNIPIYMSSVIGNLVPKIKRHIAKMERMDDHIVLLAHNKKELNTYNGMAEFWQTLYGISDDCFTVALLSDLKDVVPELKFVGKIMSNERKELRKRIKAQM